MFVGTYEHSLDGKGRVVLPSKFRNHLADSAYLAPNAGCLALWTPEEFGLMVDRLRANVRNNAADPDSLRGLAANSEEVSPDGQGRIILPGHLREFASLGSEVVVTGNFDHIEIWNIERWESMRPGLEETVIQAFSEGAGT